MACPRPVEHALKIFLESSKPQYVCRICRAQRTRQLHASARYFAADNRPYLQRLKESILGPKYDEATQRRETEATDRTREMAKQYSPNQPFQSRKAISKKGVYNIAPIVDPEVTENYVAAVTWDGLSSMGSKEWAKRIRDGGEVYEGYTPRELHQLRDIEWQSLLHNIAVELLLLQKTGHNINVLWYSRASNNTTFTQTANVQIQPTGSGAEFKSPDGNVEQRILQAIMPEENAAHLRTSVPRRLQLAQTEATASPWMAMRLNNDELKFAIAKRITQLTGRRVPDPVISSAATVEDLFNALKTKDRPQKLAESSEFERLRVDLPNVAVHNNRQTMVHKEKQVGRWKVIEAELTARNLPVTGTNHPQEKTIIEPRLSRLDRKLRRMKKA